MPLTYRGDRSGEGTGLQVPNEPSRDEMNDPVSVGITRHVRIGQVEAFEMWLGEIKTVVSGFDGYAGMNVVRPSGSDSPTYVMILRFDSYHQYNAWHQSPARAEIVERSTAMTTGDTSFEEAHGLDAWFTPPTRQVRHPARYKTAILTVVGLYPLILMVGALVATATGFPVYLGTLVTVAIVAAIATYWVMPWITRVARHWLFP